MKELPEELYEDLLAQRVVIFAGAGTTTESGAKVFSGPTFYESIKEKCKYPKTKPEPSFPDLMQFFCDVEANSEEVAESCTATKIPDSRLTGEPDSPL